MTIVIWSRSDWNRYKCPKQWEHDPAYWLELAIMNARSQNQIFYVEN